MKCWLLALALLLSSQIAPAVESDHPAAARVRAFLDSHGTQQALPDARELASMRGYLARPLLHSLEGAIAYQRRYIRKFPGEKAPLDEGNLFHSSTFEGYEDFVVGQPAEIGGGAVIVPVRFRSEKRYWKRGDQGPWMDQYVLTMEDGDWRISDVIFLLHAPFGTKGGSRLRANLDYRWPDPPGH